MKADELIQQYQSGAITAQELVEGVWEGVRAKGADDRRANITIARIEKIRQVKEEIAQLICAIEQGEAHKHESRYNKKTWRHTTDIWRRILVREQSALAELSRGIRPEVLTYRRY
jgi:hypothetical protein